MRDLSSIREDINKVDEQLSRLFDERMQLSEEVALYKQAHGLPVFDKEREQQILDRHAAEFPNRDKAFHQSLRTFYQTLMDLSKERQNAMISQPVAVGYYGVPGSFTQAAFLSMFGPETKGVSYESFSGLFEALKNKQIRFAVVPCENSSTGMINEVYDLLAQNDLYIVRQTELAVEQNLLGIKGSRLEQVKEVYSHPQAFAQSSAFLSAYPEWKLIPYSNTARSADLVAKSGDPSKVCIAGLQCAGMYGLTVLAKAIQDNKHNFTRFLVVSASMEPDPTADRISLYFTLKHQPGSLYSALEAASSGGINLLQIQSRPVKGKVWEYAFFVDLEGSLEDPAVQKVLKIIQAHCLSFKVLGNYHKIPSGIDDESSSEDKEDE